MGAWYDVSSLYATFSSRSTPLLAMMDASIINDGKIALRVEKVEGDDDWDFALDHTFSILNLEEETMYKPLFLAILYCLGVIGVLSLHESTDDVPLPLVKKGKKCPFSPCDGLKAISMTPFGRYLLSFSEEFPHIKHETASLILDDELLIITFDGSDMMVRKILNTIAIPLGHNLYSVSRTSFLANCSNRSELGELMKSFREIAGKLPDNWSRFLDELSKKNEKDIRASCISYTVDEETFMKLRKDKSVMGISFATGGKVICEHWAKKEFEKLLEEYGYKNDIQQILW